MPSKEELQAFEDNLGDEEGKKLQLPTEIEYERILRLWERYIPPTKQST